jgi:hypothetical protein
MQHQNMDQDTQQSDDSALTSRFMPAVVMIAVGAIFLLSNLHIFVNANIWEYWPVIPMIFGAFKLADSPYPQGRMVGGALLVIGGIILA